LTTMQSGPIHGFDGFTFWEDLCFLIRGTSKTYIFKENDVEIDRQTASCENYIITLISDQTDPCAEMIDSVSNTETMDSIDNSEMMDSINDCDRSIGTVQTVCGFDGITYENICEAEQAGIDVKYIGECTTDFNCARHTGTIIKENCDNGTPFYFVRTNEGHIYDLNIDTNIAYSPKEGDRINFDFVERIDPPFCSISEKTIIITCLEVISEVNNAENEDRLNRISDLGFMVSPNPTEDQLTVHLPTTSTAYQLSIYNMLGRTMHQEEVLPLTTSVNLNMTGYEQGIYYIELRTDGKRGIQKVVKHGLE